MKLSEVPKFHKFKYCNYDTFPEFVHLGDKVVWNCASGSVFASNSNNPEVFLTGGTQNKVVILNPRRSSVIRRALEYLRRIFMTHSL